MGALRHWQALKRGRRTSNAPVELVWKHAARALSCEPRLKPTLTRIFSDLHYGDRASALNSLAGLRPLLDDASHVILNGDTLDTRPGPSPDFTRALREEVTAFFTSSHPAVTFLGGNHDPDISSVNALELAGRQVLVTHGDILFEDMVPWGRDAAVLRERIAAELARLTPAERADLESCLVAYRRAAVTIPQRHQSEQNGFKYLVGFLADTIWPPLRIFSVLRAWREAPERAAAVVARYRLPANFFVMGHTHHLGARPTRSGVTAINTGSFCPPSAPAVVDVTENRISLRQIERRGVEYRLSTTLAEFALARS